MIGGFSHMFATMFGNAFLTQAVKTGGSKLVKAFSKRAYKALVRIEKAELAGPGANKVTKQIQSTAITRASKTHTNFMKEIRGFKRRIDNSITGAVPKQLNSLLGKVFHTGGPRKAFTTHAKEFAINEIITMPIMYSMYKNDKNNYPEMKNQSFLNYYSSTLPFSIGFMGATASSKLFQRKLSGNLINKLKNNPNAVRRTIHVAGMIGAAGTKAFSRIGNITQEIKKEAFSNRPVGDLFTISGAKDFQQRLSTAAGTGYRKAESYIGNDSDSIIHTTKLAVEKLSHSSRPQATEILSKNFNSMVGREGKIMSFVNKLLPNENKIQRNVIESNDKSFNHLLQDRGVWQFENKVYDTKAFHLGKIRDLAAESLDKFNVGIGSVRVHPFKVISYGLNFLKTDFNRNLNSTLSGTKTTSIGSTYFAQIARNAEKEFTSDMTEEEKLKKYFSTLVKGPNVSQKDNESLTTAYVDSFKRGHEDVEQVYQGLNNNFSRGFLGINENSLFYIDKNKTGNIILGNGKNVTLHNTSFAFGTTDNKSTIASSINRMLGVTRTSGGDIIAGKDRSRLLTREELIKERKQHGYKDDELLTAFDDTMLRWEIGGGGTTSVGNVLSGWFKKYTSHEWAGNMFNKDYTKAIRAGTPENKRFYIDNVSTNITKAQDNIFDIITSKGSKWSDFIDSFNAEGFSVRGEGGKRLSISDLSLNGVTNKDTALDKLHNMLGFAKAHKQDSLVHMLNTMRKKISTEQASDVQTVLSELNPSGIPISKNYEAILLQTFTASAKNTEKTNILDTLFDTAKSLNPDSSVDFNSPINLLSINKHTQSIKRSLHNITKFNEKSNQLLDNIIKENNIYQQTIEQVEGKWGIHMHSTQNMNTKFVKPTDDTLYLVPDTGGFFPSFTKPDTIGNSFLKNSIGSSGHIVMGSLETFNKAMGTMGLGIDNYRSSTEFLTNYFKKRILPIGGIIGGMDILDRVTDQNPLFNNTPLQDGVYQVGANAYAGVRLASAGIMDSLGVTTAAKYMEDLLPGSINSPLSGAVRGVLPPLAGAMLGFSKFGPVGGLTGGIIGSAVSAITAGGPLAAFDCLPGSELIKTAEGFKPIEEIVENELVYTIKNRLKKVTKIWKREPKKLVQLEISGVPITPRASDNHAILTKTKTEIIPTWKMIKDIKPNEDYLAFSKKRNKKRSNIDLIWYVDTKICPLIIIGESSNRKIFKLKYINKPKHNFGNTIINKNIFQEPIDINWNSYIWPSAFLGQIIGWFLAEGSIMSSKTYNGITLALNMKNKKEVDWVLELIEKSKSFLPVGSINIHKTCIQISSSIIGSIFKSICFNKNNEKSIHPDLMEITSDAFYYGILGSYLDGDGHILLNENKEIKGINFSTTSLDLAWDIWNILLQHDIIASVNKYENYLNGERKKDKIVLSINNRLFVQKFYKLCEPFSYKLQEHKIATDLIKPKLSNTEKYFYMDTDYAYFNLKNKTYITSDEYRYDLEVEDDSSYVGFGITYHNSWNISKDRAQVLAELKGEALINVKRGRFWEMGSGHFWGTQTNYFRPHMFALMKADYKDSPNFKTSIFDEIASYVDPSAYNRRHYFSRPSPEHPGILSNIPIIGSIIGMPNTSQHQDVLNMEQMTQDRYGYRKSVLNNNYLGQDNDEFGEVSDYQKIGRASGLGASQEHINNFYSEPISGSSIDSRLSSAFYNIKEVAGLRGFLTEQVQEQITGNQQLFAEKPRIEANNIGSLNRQFWDLNLGGMGGLCIAEDMLIKTDNGKKEIQYINIGELVFTNKGYYKVIGKTNRSLFENETILKINTEINSNIECTKNHIIPILRKVNNKANCFTDCFKIFEIPAEEIKLGDYLCYPVNKTQKLKNKIANMNKYMFFENCFLIKVTEITELESTKQFYDLEIESYHYFTVNGILVHNSEGIRRIFSRKTSDISYWNPIRNTAPKWLPGNEYYVDIQHGDPYSKIEMGEARLPGESYRTLYDVKISPAGEGQLLGVSEQEALNYYAGNLETVVPRFNAEDQITKRKNEIINELKGMGSLVKEQSIAIDIKRDITAESDGTIKLDNGEIVPVAFAPLVKGKFLSGSTSGLNAFLALSGKSKGMLIGIDSQTGETSEAIIQANIEKYKEEAGKDYEIRQRAIQHMERLQSEGVPVSEGIAYSHLDRLRILGDVAYYSNNFKNELRIVKEQSKAGLLSPAEEAQVDVILEEVDAKKQKFLFKNRRFTNTGIALTREGQLEQEAVDNKYNFVEKGIGAAWEGLTYLRNPITSRFIGNRDALQAYEEDVVYGQEFKKWQTPIDSYVNPFFNKMAQENNPIQGGLSGATAGLIFGGPMGSAMGAIAGSVYSATVGQVVHNSGWVPDEVKKQRQILMAADIAEHQRYKELYDATSYNEYKFRMRNTITDSLESNQPLTIERIAKIANKPDKYYVRQILSGVTTDNINETRRLLAPEVATLMDKSLGVDTNTRGSDYAGGYNIDPDDISDYDRPIEDIVVKTFQREGLDHHRVGLGWNDTIRRMAMEERLSGPISAMNNSESPERNITARVNGSHISRQLKLILKEYNAQVSLENNNGPVNIIVEVI